MIMMASYTDQETLANGAVCWVITPTERQHIADLLETDGTYSQEHITPKHPLKLVRMPNEGITRSFHFRSLTLDM